MSYVVKYVFVKFSSPNECDKILKIPNEQPEPTDYMSNCSTDYDAPLCDEHRPYSLIHVLTKLTVIFARKLALTATAHRT